MTPPSTRSSQPPAPPITDPDLVFAELAESDLALVASALVTGNRTGAAPAALNRIQAGLTKARAAYASLAAAYTQAEGERDDWRRQALAAQAQANAMYDLLHPKKT